MGICKNCGHLFNDKDNSCMFCGTPVTNDNNEIMDDTNGRLNRNQKETSTTHKII